MARLTVSNTVLLEAIKSTQFLLAAKSFHRWVKHTAEGTATNIFRVICSTSIFLLSIKWFVKSFYALPSSALAKYNLITSDLAVLSGSPPSADEDWNPSAALLPAQPQLTSHCGTAEEQPGSDRVHVTEQCSPLSPFNSAHLSQKLMTMAAGYKCTNIQLYYATLYHSYKYIKEKIFLTE